jgi:hypothetical protein
MAAGWDAGAIYRRTAAGLDELQRIVAGDGA